MPQIQYTCIIISMHNQVILRKQYNITKTPPHEFLNSPNSSNNRYCIDIDNQYTLEYSILKMRNNLPINHPTMCSLKCKSYSLLQNHLETFVGFDQVLEMAHLGTYHPIMLQVSLPVEPFWNYLLYLLEIFIISLTNDC